MITADQAKKFTQDIKAVSNDKREYLNEMVTFSAQAGYRKYIGTVGLSLVASYLKSDFESRGFEVLIDTEFNGSFTIVW